MTPTISGIYCITNLINNKYYIGSATHVKDRWSRHKHDFRFNKHCNKHLQKAVNKYGIDNFNFEILCNCNKEDLLYFEQKCMDFLKPEYNLQKIAGSSFGRPTTEETKEKLRLCNIGKIHSQESKDKRSKATKGIPKPEHSIRMKAIWAKKRK